MAGLDKICKRRRQQPRRFHQPIDISAFFDRIANSPTIWGMPLERVIPAILRADQPVRGNEPDVSDGRPPNDGIEGDAA
jgi:hypothetical protein